MVRTIIKSFTQGQQVKYSSGRYISRRIILKLDKKIDDVMWILKIYLVLMNLSQDSV